MCGDLDEPDVESERLYDAFLQAAETAIHEAIDHRGGSRRRIEQKEGDDGELPEASLHAYMDGLFGEILSACVKDARRTTASQRYRVLAAQSIVLARLAGFMAGHLDRREEPLAGSIEALMAGYGARHLPHSHD